MADQEQILTGAEVEESEDVAERENAIMVKMAKIEFIDGSEEFKKVYLTYFFPLGEEDEGYEAVARVELKVPFTAGRDLPSIYEYSRRRSDELLGSARRAQDARFGILKPMLE